MSEAMYGRIVSIDGQGVQFPTMFLVDVCEEETKEVHTITVPNQQSAHPLSDVAQVEKAKRGPNFGGGRPIHLEGVKVAFWEANPAAGRWTGWIMHRDEYEECDQELDEFVEEETND